MTLFARGTYPLIRANRVCPMCGHSNRGAVMCAPCKEGFNALPRDQWIKQVDQFEASLAARAAP
jgi:hypothetical protein